MGQFVYFIPDIVNGTSVTLDTLAKHGLATVFDTGGFSNCEVTNGPGGKRGVVFSYGSAKETRCKKAEQTWREIHGTKAWVGYYKDDIPTPADLQRDSWISGYFTELGDGEKWIAPIARLADGLPNLPCSRDLVDGQWTRGGVLKKHQKLWSIAEKFWSIVEAKLEAKESDGETVSLDFPQENDFAVIALAANYRIGRTEAAILGLLNDDSVSEVLNALIDWPSIIKKKIDEAAQENSSADPGKQE